MTPHRFPRLRLASLATLALIGPATAQAPETFGLADNRAPLPAKPAFVPFSVRSGLDLSLHPAFSLPPVDMNALFAQDAQQAENGNKVVRVSIGRNVFLNGNDGIWHDLGNGRWLWTAEIESRGAVGIRVHLAELNLPAGAELIVYPVRDPSHISGSIEGRGPNDDGQMWVGTQAGERVRLEYFVDTRGGTPPATEPPFIIDSLQHVYRDPTTIPVEEGAGACHNDITCYATYNNLKQAVARIDFVSGGSGFLCSGTQLNTLAGDLTPYFLTANHCINTAAEATSAEVFWKYQTSTCNGVPPGIGTVPSSVGCTLYSTGVASDYTLLMVIGALPSGLWWAGWTSAVQPPGEPGVAIHHPSGSYKRISFGNYSATLDCGGASHHRVNWSNGPTEPGSSGSGFFKTNTQQLVGQLHCGPSACGNETYDQYGRFADTYGSISGLLAEGSDDSLEENDTCGGNPDTAVGTYSNLVVKSTDEDWYEIAVPNGAQLTVSLSFTHSNGDIDAELWVNCGDPTYADISNSITNAEQVTWVNDTGSANTVAWRVYLYSDTRSTYNMTVSLTPPNNGCLNAITISDNQTLEGSNYNATNSVAGTCGLSSTSPDVWYEYTASATGSLQIHTAGSALDTVVSVHGAACGTSLICNDDAAIGSPDAYGTLQSYLTYPVISGTTYWIRVAGYNNLEGSFRIWVDTDTGAPYCLGDGISVGACPCSNHSTTSSESGCDNSTGNAGRLLATGLPDVSADTVTLSGSGMPPNSTCLYFQGTSAASANFGDGKRCAQGTVIRLGTKTNSASGTSSWPSGSDPDLHIRGAIPPTGGTRYYQCWYRNAVAFCTPSTFNLSNGYLLVWRP